MNLTPEQELRASLMGEPIDPRFQDAVHSLRRELAPQREIVADLRSALLVEAWLRMELFLHELKDDVGRMGGNPEDVRAAVVKLISTKIQHIHKQTHQE